MEQATDWLASLSALADTSSDAVIVKDVTGRILAWNHAAEELYGFPASDVIGKPISIIAPPGGWGEVLGLIDVVRSQGAVKGLETTRRRRDGQLVEIALTVSPVRDAAGELLGIVSVARDITGERRRDRFREMRWMASIVESSDDAIIGKTPDGEIVSWNQAAERLYGWSADEALGRHISILAPPDRRDEIPGLIARVLRKETVDHFVTERMDRQGRRVHVSLALSPIVDSGGHVIGISTIARRVQPDRSA